METPTAAPATGDEEALEVAATLGTAEPPARGAGARGDTTTHRAEATEATEGMRTEALTELAAPAPPRTADRVPDAEEETLEGVATLGAAEPPARGDTATPRAEATEATGGTRTEALAESAAPAPRRTMYRGPTSLS